MSSYSPIMTLGAVTTTSLQEELGKAKRQLDQTERKIDQIQDATNRNTSGNHPQGELPPRERLLGLELEIQSLELTRDLAAWWNDDDGIRTGTGTKPGTDTTIIHDAKTCVGLAHVLMRHKSTLLLLQHVYEKEYQQFHRYVRANVLVKLRQSLRRIKFPSKEANSILLEEEVSDTNPQESVSSLVLWLTKLQQSHEPLKSHMKQKKAPQKLESVVELCRPIVERVTFHFLQPSEDRISSTKIDRLPEWVLNYIRETTLEPGGPLDFVSDVASVIQSEAIIYQFLQEIIHLAAFVIVQRKFFRHEKIVGPKSTPLLLSGAIEQLLAFDSYVRNDLVPLLQEYPTGLFQLLIANDHELWTWFLHRERAWTMSTLFDDDTSTTLAPRRISPRAELFSALIYSIQSKAVLFDATFSSRYIANVGVPLCQHFLEAVHESSTELRGLMAQRKLLTPVDLTKNLESWMELINGTHMAAIRLHSSASDSDLGRVARSMDRLRDALVEECATTLVETVIMERAKFASYLMRCSHMLSQDEDDYHNEKNSPAVDQLSPDLQEMATIFATILSVCTELKSANDSDNELVSIISFAPLALRSHVTERLADKFLEVILDAHGMTPEISLFGAHQFQVDAMALFSDSCEQHPLVLRLLEVARFAAAKNCCDFKLILSSLVSGHATTHQQQHHLQYKSFARDGTLLDEAVSMIRAKGYHWMQLEDVISVLNRRQEENTT